MAICACFALSSCGIKTQLAYYRDDALFQTGILPCAVFGSSRNNRSSVFGRFNDKQPFGGYLDPFLISKGLPEWKTKVRVAADYPDSKPDASPLFGNLGYHPLEDVSSLEKRKNIEHADRRLTDAEMARTLAEVNSNAILFASFISDQDHVFGSEVQYLVDEHGDFYFQLEDDSEFLATLNAAAEMHLHVVIGYGNIEDWVIEQEEPQQESSVEDAGSIDSDSEDDEDEEVWTIISPEAVEFVLEELAHESSESVGDWAGLDTLQSVHPMDFAERLTEAASADYAMDMERPSRNLRIVGQVRHVTEEEESYVQRIWYDRFRWEAEGDEDEEQVEEQEREKEVAEAQQARAVSDGVSTSFGQESCAGPIKELEFEGKGDVFSWNPATSSRIIFPVSQSDSENESQGESCEEEYLVVTPMESKSLTRNVDNTGDGDEFVEAADYSDAGVSFYKMEMKSVHFVDGFRDQSSVDLFEFQQAKPDVLAHSAAAIIKRLNDNGTKMGNALKAMCHQRKGLQVEDVSVIGIDSFGVDLRVHCGREVQTLRIPFSQRATSVESAEKLLNQLLYPRRRQRRRRRSRPEQNPN